jgi:hypothetical protein
MKCRPPVGLATIVRAAAAGKKPETIDHPELICEGIGDALFKPTNGTSANPSQHDTRFPCFSEKFWNPPFTPYC